MISKIIDIRIKEGTWEINKDQSFFVMTPEYIPTTKEDVEKLFKELIDQKFIRHDTYWQMYPYFRIVFEVMKLI